MIIFLLGIGFFPHACACRHFDLPSSCAHDIFSVKLFFYPLDFFSCIVIKIGILYRNDQFNQEELWTAEQFKHKFHSTAMAIISFFEVEFSYDRNFLLQALNECRALLKNLVSRHLTDKSINRIEHVFNFFANPTFLDDVFSRDSNHKELLGKIVSDMHKLMEDGSL
ncbi:UNVERIFIED_CONTAM: Tumor necrosis factor alpha-induced protein 8-like protein [Trichonephila clavipes]